MVGRVGFEPTITGARDQYLWSGDALRPCCPHSLVVWTTAPLLGRENRIGR